MSYDNCQIDCAGLLQVLHLLVVLCHWQYTLLVVSFLSPGTGSPLCRAKRSTKLSLVPYGSWISYCCKLHTLGSVTVPALQHYTSNCPHFWCCQFYPGLLQLFVALSDQGLVHLCAKHGPTCAHHSSKLLVVHTWFFCSLLLPFHFISTWTEY